jgi:mannose/fructose-specific phosphotransferase system component IIA
MIGALVVTHGHLGQELVAAAEMIVGEISHIKPSRSAGMTMSMTPRRILKGILPRSTAEKAYCC